MNSIQAGVKKLSQTLMLNCGQKKIILVTTATPILKPTLSISTLVKVMWSLYEELEDYNWEEEDIRYAAYLLTKLQLPLSLCFILCSQLSYSHVVENTNKIILAINIQNVLKF